MATVTTTQAKVAMPLLAAATALLVIAYGLALDAPGAPLALLPLVPVVIAAALAAGRGGRDAVALALTPVAIALVVVTVLVGTFVASLDTPAWWVAGGVLAALPVLALGRR